MFYVEKRKKYTDIENLKISIRLCGYEKLVLVHDGIDVKEVALEPKRYKEYLIDFPYSDYNKGCFGLLCMKIKVARKRDKWILCY